ncbi:hypothetical protein [Herbaspirillum huttiense]|uniref:Uncharacterized protein n=1 Tax=Herbaspirillum huttiense subsp. lycopersici TaxID=3074428 RepID=A0ABU2EV77_9BURK|nr:hypothetical protein [Herbaspirillum huttiense]MDR9851742.1 hypothetical protein [Herbaspirillum huttiense SE1]
MVFVGQNRLDKVLRERFPALIADIHHHPVLLFPDAPASSLYIPDLLRARYGVAGPKSAFPAQRQLPENPGSTWTLAASFMPMRTISSVSRRLEYRVEIGSLRLTLP